ncbi:hypothetical protein [Antribacter gilvus]|uniref:hypothetical protein n=1 Tax=Antribacter gilvus TaxID=2304675 RepID=UPI000F7882EE|nr:hypothetical protein [Antribacter gilvus]
MRSETSVGAAGRGLGGVSPVATQTIRVLDRAGLDLGPGLTDDQIAQVEGSYGFRFNRDHVDVLRQVTPAGWIDWLGDAETVRGVLDWPIRGVLFDVGHAFWMPAWGERPPTKAAAIDRAREHLHRAPQLVPVRGHRYLPAAPQPSRAPVFSAYQTDVIYYGSDLADYCAHEYVGQSTGRRPRRIPFWSDLVDGAGGVTFWD